MLLQEDKLRRHEENKRLMGRIFGAGIAFSLFALRRKTWNFDSIKYVEKAVSFLDIVTFPSLN